MNFNDNIKELLKNGSTPLPPSLPQFISEGNTAALLGFEICGHKNVNITLRL